MERNLTVVSYSHILIMETEFLQKEFSFFFTFIVPVGFPDPRNGMCVLSFRHFRPCNESPCSRRTVYYFPMDILRFQFPHDVASRFY